MKSNSSGGWNAGLPIARHLAGCVLLVAACTGSNDPTTPIATTDPTQPESTTTTAVKPSSTETSADTERSESSVTGEGPVFTLVRFENNEHQSTAPLDEALVRTKVTEAAEASFDNWITCLVHIELCDFNRDVAPSLSNVHLLDMRLNYDGLEPGERYRRGPGETRRVVDTTVLDLTPPVLGLVDICAVYTGEMYVPGADGEPEKITDDEQLSVILRYQVVSDEAGVLTAEGRQNIEVSDSGDLTLCDE